MDKLGEFHRLEEWLANSGDTVFQLQSALTRTRAVGPENGGPGEMGKALLIEEELHQSGLEFDTEDAPDRRVEDGARPNILTRIPGQEKRTLWLFGHLDVVPPGDLGMWQGDPWEVRKEGDFLIGRGVEDNQQAIVSMLLLARAAHELGITPRMSIGLVFMSDEECGSEYGLARILQNKRQLFAPEDIYIVPDGGSPRGNEIEIAEKGQLWLKFTIQGQQCHASTPEAGKNALVAASALILELQTLYNIFPQQNRLFRPPVSTFVPTLHEANVPAINILPGKDVFFLDCRLLPGVQSYEVKNRAQEICAAVAGKYGVTIEMATAHEQEASETPAASPGVRLLAAAIKAVCNVEPKLTGIGGITVAGMLRSLGLPAMVWSTLLNTCHQPNEKSSISATLRDAAVFGHIAWLPEHERV